MPIASTRFYKHAFIRAVAAFYVVLCACSCSKGGCVLAGDYEDWSRNIQVTPHDSTQIFNNDSYRLDTAINRGSYVSVSLNVDSVNEIPDAEWARKEPRILQFRLTSHYLKAALQSWRDAGFLDTSDNALTLALREGSALYRSTFVQTIMLTLPTAEKATYSFGPEVDPALFSTSGRLQMEQYGQMPIFPAFTLHSMTGSVRILEKLTPDSGKFSYRFEVEYLPGQRSIFQGTVTFEGTSYSHSCGW